MRYVMYLTIKRYWNIKPAVIAENSLLAPFHIVLLILYKHVVRCAVH